MNAEQFTERRAGSLDLHNRVIKLESSMLRIETTLEQNSEATEDILSIVKNARGFFNVLGAVGALAKWTLATAAAVVALWASFRGWK